MKIDHNISLKEYNTFGVEAKCQHFVRITSKDDFLNLFKDDRYQNNEKLILGGGSNILFTKDHSGIVIKNDIKGIEKINENEDHIWVKVGAGENWHSFVMKCVEYNYAGLENLSLIPGCVGASPMQNIGAYGVEVKDYVESVICLDLSTAEESTYSGSECEFGYRTSIFKTRLKGQILITHVVFKLNKKPIYNISYGAIKQELEKMNVTELSLKKVSQAVVNIRNSKLPNPKEIGNAGSFFKNPVIEASFAADLLKKQPEMPIYPAEDGKKKVAAGWLIEKSGWKGKRLNDHGVHKKQALVLVNYGNAKGSDIDQMASDIQASVLHNFGISLEKEVNII